MKILKRLFIVAAMASLCTVVAGCQKERSRTEFMLGTICSIRIWGGSDGDLEGAFMRIREIEALMSRHRKDSEIRGISAKGADNLVLSSETCLVMKNALEFGSRSGGKFDVTIAPVAELWGFETEKAAIPESTALKDALSKVDYRKVELSEDCLLKAAPGQRVDLGGIAKGYASDEVARVLKEAGVKRGLINLGGNVLVFGRKKDGKPWKLGIQDPLEQTGTPMGTLDVEGGAVVTSGIYERYFEQDGRKYHHLLDPATGYPIENDLAGVSITTPSGMNADALSTTLFLVGIEKGCELIESYPQSGAVFITKERRIITCGTASGSFEVLNEAYEVVDRR